MVDDYKDSEDLNIFLNLIGETGDEAPVRSMSFNGIDLDSSVHGHSSLEGGDSTNPYLINSNLYELNNPFQDSDSNQAESPIYVHPDSSGVYIAPRAMISHLDSFSNDPRLDSIDDARILPDSPAAMQEFGFPRLRVPASPRAFVYTRTVGSPRFGSPTSTGSPRLIDTASPFESVKEAVTKFGGITDWKAHKIQTIERRKMVDEELENIQRHMPEHKKATELAEYSKQLTLKELESTKEFIDKLKLELEKAQKEEQQAKQDSELAKMHVEEIEKGVADEASVAVKAQLEVAKARYLSGTSELQSVRQEIETICNEYDALLREKDLAAKNAESAILEANEVEKKMDSLTIELIATKELLETVHTTHLEAEEKKFSAAMSRDQDAYNWEKELKMVEENIGRLNQEIQAAADMRTKLEAASALKYDLKAELATLIKKADLNGDDSNCDSGVNAAIDSAKKELEEVKFNIEKAASEVNTLKKIVVSLQSELERERKALAETKQREAGQDWIQTKKEEASEELTETAKKLQQAAKEAKDAKSLSTEARKELGKAKEMSEQAKIALSTTETKLVEAKQEKDIARASENLALAAIKVLQETECSQGFEDITSPRSVIISTDEYNELSKQVQKAEEEANKRLAEVTSQVKIAKEEESRISETLEEVNREMSIRKEELEDAKKKAEEARNGKVSMEQELRKWRSENVKKRTETEKSPRSSTEERYKEHGYGQAKSFAFGEQSSSHIGGGGSNNLTLTPETKKKKKKLSFLPKVFMFLSRKKSNK